MILIAPDKFKGTLSAREAADAIARALGDRPYVKAPMADGGEGTASILCADTRWEQHDGYYVDNMARTAVLDSSAYIGAAALYGRSSRRDILHASSAPLGIKVREIIKGGCRKVIIGIGGTATCDGGVGFLEGLGIDHLAQYRDKIMGLSDVRVPLVAPIGEPSALMFAPQKGATPLDMEILAIRLADVQRRYGHGRTSPWDGAGGGLGFAIASAIGAPCQDGAQYVLTHHNIKWDDIDLVITGEGRIDRQTEQGKVVDTMMRAAQEHGIPCLAVGGCVEDGLESDWVVSTAHHMPSLDLTPQTAALRLTETVRAWIRSGCNPTSIA